MNAAYLGYLIAFLSMFVGALSLFPFTDTAREWGSVATNHFRLLLAFIVITICCMLIDGISLVKLFTLPSAMQYAYLGSSGILGLALGDYFAFHAMAILGTHRSSIFNTLAPGAAFVFGYLILSENPGWLGLIGITISIGGMVWFLWVSGGEDKALNIQEYGSIKKGVIYGILSGICQGLHITLSKKGLLDPTSHISPVHATWIRVFVATVAYFTATILRGRLKQDVIMKIKAKRQVIFKASYATVFGLVLSILFVMWSVKLAEVAVVQTILSLSPIIVVPIAYLFYKERISYKTFFAAVISIGGVFILIWRDNILFWVQTHLH